MGIDRESRDSEARNSKDRYSDLARLLRGRREQLGLSRRDVVSRTRLSYPYVSQLEGGYRAPSVGSARKLADALDLPVEDVVRAAGGDLPESQTPTPPARRPARAGEFRNPAYSAGIMHDAEGSPDPTPSSMAEAPPAPFADRPLTAAEASPQAPRTRFAVGAAASTGLTASRARPGESDLEAVADDVGRLLRGLPPESRLDALALAQSRLMAEMVQEQVRRATES
jgi:transcriptional regulator with XRE-family HTH domain